MSEPKNWNRERTRCLLRYAEKNSGPWDWDDAPDASWQFGDIPGEEDVGLLITAPDLLDALEKFVAFHKADHEQLCTAQLQALYDSAINAAKDAIQKATGEV